MAGMIFIYGPPGSGKNTVGRLLAERLALPFYDIDREVEALAGRPVPVIFAEMGEPAFRRMESAALRSLLDRPAGVAAVGGGALLDEQNRALAEAADGVLCLDASEETLLGRLRREPGRRPLLSGGLEGRLTGLLSARAAHYASFPVILDTTGLSPERAAWQAQVRLGRFHVRGMGNGYDVVVQRGGLEAAGESLKARGLTGPVALVSDGNVAPIFGDRVAASLERCGYRVKTVILPAGEEHKNLQTIARLWEALVEGGQERGSTVLALGGGVITDLAGFAASAYLRGVAWAALPTSLLGMVDASLGGKTGVDLPQGKNLVGAFHPPRLVLADPAALDTLPEDELRSGMAEVVKHGVIADPALFGLCAQGWPALKADWDDAVRRAIAVKVQVIEEDPYERGRRAVLNLGHTLGHALELASGYRLRHGEAVAIGTAAEARLAEQIRLAEPGLAQAIEAALTGLGLPVCPPAGIDGGAAIQAVGVDKKRAEGKARFALPVSIGEVRYGIEVEEELWQPFLSCTGPT